MEKRERVQEAGNAAERGCRISDWNIAEPWITMASFLTADTTVYRWLSEASSGAAKPSGPVACHAPAPITPISSLREDAGELIPHNTFRTSHLFPQQ